MNPYKLLILSLIFLSSHQSFASLNSSNCGPLFLSIGYDTLDPKALPMSDRIPEALIFLLGKMNYKFIPDQHKKGDVPFTANDIRTTKWLKQLSDSYTKPWVRRLQRLEQLKLGQLEKLQKLASTFGLIENRQIILAIELRKSVETFGKTGKIQATPTEIIEQKEKVLQTLGQKNGERKRNDFTHFISEVHFPSVAGGFNVLGGQIPHPFKNNELYKKLKIAEKFPRVHLLLLFISSEPLPEGNDFSRYADQLLNQFSDGLDEDSTGKFVDTMFKIIESRADYDGVYGEAVLRYPLWNIWSPLALENFLNNRYPFVLDRSKPFDSD